MLIIIIKFNINVLTLYINFILSFNYELAFELFLRWLF